MKNVRAVNFALLSVLILFCMVFAYNDGYLDSILFGIGIFIIVVVAIIMAYKAFVDHNNSGSTPRGLEYVLDNVPGPILVVDNAGNYTWYNDSFYQSFYSNTNNGQKLFGRNIKDELNISMDSLNRGETINYVYRQKNYEVTVQLGRKGLHCFYLLHFHEKKTRQYLYNLASKHEPVFCSIVLDNYDDITSELTNAERIQATRDLAVTLTEWANKNEGIIFSSDSDRYLVLFEREKISALEDSGFPILDEVRAIRSAQKSFTLSIGIGMTDAEHSVLEASELSEDALRTAQERGGDQVVVKHDGNLSIYGGKREAQKNKTKTKTRVKAEELKRLILKADNILIVGHQNPDMDCFGAAVGLIDACRDLNKTAKYIFGQKENLNFELLKKYLSKSPNYDSSFISPKKAKELIRDKTLLMVVDTRSVEYMDYPDIIDQVNDIAIIDHHLKPKVAIENAIYSYIEPSASSTSELVARLLEAFDRKTVLTPFGANSLMAGIYMDTRQFFQQIGVCTFQAAAFLTRKGAEMSRTRNLLRDDFVVLAGKSATLKTAQFYCDGIFAVAMCEDYSDKAERIKTSSADELLNVKGVEASFIILKSKRGITISGRSSEADSSENEDGEVINVFQILEKLGGGGHQRMAGTQLKGVTSLEDAKVLLLEQIGKYVEKRGKRL